MDCATITICLGGDVMTGRGVDQALPHPGEPTLHEPHVRDARDYLRLAERASGPVGEPLEPATLWGDALAAMDRLRPELRIVNLETAVTTRATHWPGKSIHYRMHPSNLDVLVAVGIDGVALANNHVLDWGRAGLAETLDVLHRRGIRTAGAGADADAAWAPACFVPAGGTRVLLFAIGCGDAGVPSAWAATARRSGVARIDEPDVGEAGRWARRIARIRRDRDIVIASVHWGANWVDTIPAAQRRFARALVESGAVDLVHGHSSHHVLPVEVIRDRLVLHGCGDLVNDYEGIGTQRGVRADLGALYFAELERATGRLRTLRVVPLQRRRLRLLDADAEGRRELLARFHAPQQPPLEHEIVPDGSGRDWRLRRRSALPPPAAASAR